VGQGDGLGGEHRLKRGLRVEGGEQGGGGFRVLGATAGESARQAGQEGLEKGGGEHRGCLRQRVNVACVAQNGTEVIVGRRT
jgi:hypothetical protein